VVSAWEKPLKAVLAVYVSLLAFPVFYFSLNTYSVDPAWQFAINYFFDRGIIFGREVVWTYGPLGFLVVPHNVGHNLALATVVLGLAWAGFTASLAYILIKNEIGLEQLGVFAVCFALGGQPLYRIFDLDTYICFMSLLLLSMSFKVRWWRGCFFVSVFISVFLMFIKFTSGVISLSAVFSFSLIATYVDRGKFCKSILYPAVGVPALFTAAYLIYNPSFPDMVLYLRGAYEISSGYNVAMSLRGGNIGLALLGLTIVLYSALAYLLYRNRQESFYIALMFIPPLFFAYKHGFVRQDDHMRVYFSTVLMLLGIILMFTRPRGRAERAKLYGIAMAIVMICFHELTPSPHLTGKITGAENLKNMISAARLSRTKELLRTVEERKLRANLLPGEIRAEVGSNPVGILGWNLSYAAANSLNFSPFPVVQPYSAYTRYLDRLNSEFLEHEETAPAYLLFDEKLSIDRRLSLFDVPSVWRSVLNWYDVVYDDPFSSMQAVLMKRRAAARHSVDISIGSYVYRSGELIEVPFSEVPLLAKITLDLNLKGRVAKLFFRVPEVMMTMFAVDGRAMDEVRVVPDTLGNGILISAVPLTFRQLVRMLQGGDPGPKVRKVRFSGRGLSYYKETVSVEFLRMTSP
jgi:hypothetical protein